MTSYMEVSAEIYGTYLRYVSQEDIHPYSIDECFIDATLRLVGLDLGDGAGLHTPGMIDEVLGVHPELAVEHVRMTPRPIWSCTT